ncbi:hypothetical protein MTO96_002838 [Rhipicephalus appendiculatus]
MAVQIPAVLAVLVYFIVVVFVGVWSGRKLHVVKEDGPMSVIREDLRRRRPQQQPKRFLHRLFLADRSMSLGLGISTMTGIQAPQPLGSGGGYLNGTAEAVYTHGVLYCHAPIGYAISLVLGGCFFAQKMRTTNAVTMLDPFQEQYGRWMGLLLCLPAVCGEIFWTAAMLSALGAAAGALMEVDSTLFIVIAATTIFFYTALGGQYSVAYTDVLQICITIVFMWVCVPYVMKGRAVGTLRGPETDWIGNVSFTKAGQLLDAFLMTALGGIPWQVYFQCILGSNSDFAAETIRFVTPAAISILGMLAITSAVMSSADSSMFSASTMLTKNIYHELLRPSASEAEVALTLRIVVCLFGTAATYLALSVQSVFELWTLCSDVVYVLLFPQLVCLFYIKDTNTYGSVTAFVLGAFVRWLCGEPSLSLSASSLQLPHSGREREPWFPFRLACMAIGFLALIGGSVAAAMAFENRNASRTSAASKPCTDYARSELSMRSERIQQLTFEEVAPDERERHRAVHKDRHEDRQQQGAGVEPSPQATQPERRRVNRVAGVRDDQQRCPHRRRQAEAAECEAGRRRDAAYHEACRDVGLLATRDEKSSEEIVAAGELDRTSVCVFPSWICSLPVRQHATLCRVD